MKSKTVFCIFALFAAVMPLSSIAANQQSMQAATTQSQIDALDKEIKMFKDARDRASTEAYIARNQANQGQTQQRDWIGYRHALERQQMLEEKVKILDQKIAELEKQKSELQAKSK